MADRRAHRSQTDAAKAQRVRRAQVRSEIIDAIFWYFNNPRIEETFSPRARGRQIERPQDKRSAVALLDECTHLLLRERGHPTHNPAQFLSKLIATIKIALEEAKQTKQITQSSIADALGYSDESGLKKRFKNAKSLLNPQPKDWRTFVQLCLQGAFDDWVEHLQEH